MATPLRIPVLGEMPDERHLAIRGFGGAVVVRQREVARHVPAGSEACRFRTVSTAEVLDEGPGVVAGKYQERQEQVRRKDGLVIQVVVVKMEVLGCSLIP